MPIQRGNPRFREQERLAYALENNRNNLFSRAFCLWTAFAIYEATLALAAIRAKGGRRG